MKDLQKLVGSLNKSGALSGFLGGVAGGGLTKLVSGKSSKKTGKKAIKYGSLAAVGGLAWKAYKQYSEQNKTTQQLTPKHANRFDFTPATMPEQCFSDRKSVV